MPRAGTTIFQRSAPSDVSLDSSARHGAYIERCQIRFSRAFANLDNFYVQSSFQALWRYDSSPVARLCPSFGDLCIDTSNCFNIHIKRRQLMMMSTGNFLEYVEPSKHAPPLTSFTTFTCLAHQHTWCWSTGIFAVTPTSCISPRVCSRCATYALWFSVFYNGCKRENRGLIWNGAQFSCTRKKKPEIRTVGHHDKSASTRGYGANWYVHICILLLMQRF